MESFFRLLLGEIRREIIVLVQFKTKRCITAENKRPFLTEIVEYWSNLNYSEKDPLFESTFESTCIRHNSLITIERKPFFCKSWFKAGVENVKDLLDEASRFITFEVL